MYDGLKVIDVHGHMSTPPHFSTTWPNKASTSVVEPASPGIARTVLPLAAILCAASWSASAPRAVMATLAPSRASRAAIPLPIPRLAPVTIATLPSNCIDG